jgi:hypothetical protein
MQIKEKKAFSRAWPGRAEGGERMMLQNFIRNYY